MATTMLSQAKAKSLACFSLYSRSLLRVAALFCWTSKAAVTRANRLPIVADPSGEALSIMVCLKEVKEDREDWWPDISDCSIYV